MRQASVMLRVELGLMSRTWAGRWRGGALMGVEKGDLLVDGREAFGSPAIERDTGRELPAVTYPECWGISGWEAPSLTEG